MRNSRASRRNFAPLVAMIALTLLAVGHQGCSGRGNSKQTASSDALPGECEAYLSAIRACVEKIGVSADDRVSSMRASLIAAGAKRSASQQREACVAAQRQVSVSCR
jgi:hypothetical protein